MSTTAVYVICVKGTLDGALWAEQFEDIELQHDKAAGITTLTGEFQDQAALYGLLAQLRNLALPLISVQLLDR